MDRSADWLWREGILNFEENESRKCFGHPMSLRLWNAEMEEHEMINAAKLGDLNAFNGLVLKYQDQVYNLARFILGNQDLAEDVTQDAFIHAFGKINQFRGGSFRAWLLKIATNLCYDDIRKWKRHPHQALEVSDSENDAIESPYWMRDTNPLPEEMLEIRDLQNLLEKGLDQLPVNLRTIVILVDIQQMDYKEASRIAGIPIGTVKSRLSRGRTQLGSNLMRLSHQNPSEAMAFDYSHSKGEYYASQIR